MDEKLYAAAGPAGPDPATIDEKGSPKICPPPPDWDFRTKMAQDTYSSTVSANIKRNRLDITLRGAISNKEAERIYTDIRFCASDLESGFAVITDLSEAQFGYLTAIGTFRKISKFLTEKQVGPVIRVVGRASIIFQQLTKLSSETSYRPEYAKTREEAEMLLAERTSLRQSAA